MGSTVVEYSPHHPKGEGSSPPIAAGTGRENGTKRRWKLRGELNPSFKKW
jgi:hypothetical protein